MNTTAEFASLCLLAARTESLKKLVFSRPVDGDIVRAAGILCRIGGKIVIQIETLHSDHKATHENLPLTRETEDLLTARLGSFSQANLLTTGGDAEYRRSKKGAEILLGADKLTALLAMFGTGAALGLNTVVIPAAYDGDTRTGAAMAMISHVGAVLTIPLLYALFTQIL